MKRCLVVFVAIFGFVELSWGDVPRLISYQGRLADSFGNPITGTSNITFKLYTDSLGTLMVWQETHNNVQIQNGLYNVMLGSVNPFPADFDFARQLWLGVSIDGTPELLPRYKLGASPYALAVPSSINLWEDTLGSIRPKKNRDIRIMDADSAYDIFILTDDDSVRHSIFVVNNNDYIPGTGFGWWEARANIAAYDFNAAKYNFGLAGWSYLDRDTSAAVLGASYNGSVYTGLAMKMNDHEYAAYFNGDINSIRIWGTGSYGSQGKINMGDGDYVYLQEDEDDKLKIYASSRLAIMGGDVGIGTTSPSAKLDVQGGNIRTSGQLISTVGTGTKPLDVRSTTKVDSLNADMVDGAHLGALASKGSWVLYSNDSLVITFPHYSAFILIVGEMYGQAEFTGMLICVENDNQIAYTRITPSGVGAGTAQTTSPTPIELLNFSLGRIIVRTDGDTDADRTLVVKSGSATEVSVKLIY